MSAKRRIFTRQTTSRRWKIIVAAIAMTAAMTACAPRTTYWSPEQTPKTNKVDWVAYSHAVRSSAAGDGLSAAEREQLDRFAAEISLGYGDQVVIETPRGHRERTAMALEKYFSDRRLDTVVREVSDRAGRDRDIVMVTVGRYVVTAPKCPDWTKPSGPDHSNQVSSNFGCATVTNLGLMLADPGDLVRGRPKGPGDGDAAARLVRKYRQGKVAKPASSVTTTSSNGGGN